MCDTPRSSRSRLFCCGSTSSLPAASAFISSARTRVDLPPELKDISKRWRRGDGETPPTSLAWIVPKHTQIAAPLDEAICKAGCAQLAHEKVDTPALCKRVKPDARVVVRLVTPRPPAVVRICTASFHQNGIPPHRCGGTLELGGARFTRRALEPSERIAPELRCDENCWVVRSARRLVRVMRKLEQRIKLARQRSTSTIDAWSVDLARELRVAIPVVGDGVTFRERTLHCRCGVVLRHHRCHPKCAACVR